MIRSLFLDTANRSDIAKMVRTDAISGVTTNPSLMAKEQKGDYITCLYDICQTILVWRSSKKHLSVEVTTLDPDKMTDQALLINDHLREFSNEIDLYVKIPFLLETLPVITFLADRKVNVNATAIMKASQAKIAEDAGARIVSFFYNRGIDGGVDMDSEIRRFCSIKRSSQVICGSIRTAENVLRCWEAGAEIVTAPMKVIEEMVRHPKTDEAIQKFQQDIDSWLK